MRKLVTLVSLMLLMSVLFVLMPKIGHAASVPKLYLNGKQMEAKAEPRLVNDYTLVPIRVVAEGLGYDVTWTEKTRNVTVFNGVSEVQLTINQKEALVNGKTVDLDSPAVIDKNITYIPLRFVGENLGLDVYWDSQTRSVHLNKKADTEVVVPSVPVFPPASGTDKPSTDQGTIPVDLPVVDPPVTSEPAQPAPTDSGNGGDSNIIPSDVLALIKSIEFDGVGRIAIKFDGQLTPNNVFWLSNPDRLVLDIPNSSFSPDFMQQLNITGGGIEGNIIIDTLGLKQVRYSYYSNSPSTVRIVLDMALKTDYTATMADGEYDIDLFMKDAIIPPVTNTQTDTNGNKIFKIVLDAGHGAKDPGAKSIDGRWEKEFNLAVVLKIKALLDKEPRLAPYLTRSDDTFVELNDRAKFANNLNADLFISIHANSYVPEATGTETYYNRANSKAFADLVHRHLVAATGLPDRKVRQAGFVVIKKTTMPAVLLESGYLTNKTDNKALFSEDVQNRIAAQIVAAIKEYFNV